ncbi:hypothetical protein OSB04_004703 [Centaurea solstitialis]|uniref:TITAN-like protein n=1 Tax=Centaurea solstitialis TaxID=347529 RepID=A0AA38TEK7_9ASTR|nr:hypothetical protein OSB04_004703 [Centaurea solstitialis]
MATEAPSSETNKANPSTVPTKKKKKNNEFEFCKVCRLNHNQGRRHNYFPNHIKSLSSFLSRFQSKIGDVRFFVKNPSLLRPELASRNRFWCVFCELDVTEHGSSFACEKAIAHLASEDHLKNLKSFMWKHGGGMDQVDRFKVSEADLAKYEKKCISMKNEGASEQSRGALIGPSNDIQNELKFDYVDNFDRNHVGPCNSSFPNAVLPLQNQTNEKYQVFQSDISGGAASSISSYDNKSLPLASNAKRSNNLKGEYLSTRHNLLLLFSLWFYFDDIRICKTFLTEGHLRNGQGKKCQVYAEKKEANGEVSSAGSLNLTRISSTIHETDAGNVHSGAPPPWFDTTNGIHLDPAPKPGLETGPVTKTVKSKLNPKRVGAAWAENERSKWRWREEGCYPLIDLTLIGSQLWPSVAIWKQERVPERI